MDPIDARHIQAEGFCFTWCRAFRVPRLPRPDEV
jgi:hypothetical protein